MNIEDEEWPPCAALNGVVLADWRVAGAPLFALGTSDCRRDFEACVQREVNDRRVPI